MLGLTRRDVRLARNLLAMQVRDRYLGSTLGAAWAIANPLFMLVLYTFIFGFVLKVRLPGAETTFAYSLWLITGFGPWLATVEALTAATHSVVGASGIVKNLAMKTELLPIAATGVGLITLAVCLSFVVVLTVVDGRGVSMTIAWLPMIVAAHFALLAAIGLWLSAANVFVRDLGLALPNLLTIAMFATPIFYPLASLPPMLQRVTHANPFYVLFDAYRAVLLDHGAPSVAGLGYVAVLAAIVGAGGLVIFRRLKGQFSSML
jgi:lipopolysaccharide transport system permease protein